MQELFVVGGGFDGVADGVAEVEDHAQAGFFFVFADDVGFDANRGGDDASERGWLTAEDGVGVSLHETEEFCVVDDAGFDRLLQACPELSRGEGCEDIRVGEDGLRMVEAADDFPGYEVDACFSHPMEGVDLR